MTENTEYAVDWTAGGRVHNWRNYISERLRTLWETFTPDQQDAIQANAEEMAGEEDWE